MTTVLGTLAILAAAVSLGLAIRESLTLPTHTDPALGYTFAPVLALVGLALLATGRALRRIENEMRGEEDSGSPPPAR